MLIAIIGPDRYLVGQSLKNYIAKYAPNDGGLGDLNLTRLDGARIGPDDLARTVQAMGFFGDTRLVAQVQRFALFEAPVAVLFAVASRLATAVGSNRSLAQVGLARWRSTG